MGDGGLITGRDFLLPDWWAFCSVCAKTFLQILSYVFHDFKVSFSYQHKVHGYGTEHRKECWLMFRVLDLYQTHVALNERPILETHSLQCSAHPHFIDTVCVPPLRRHRPTVVLIDASIPLF